MSNDGEKLTQGNLFGGVLSLDVSDDFRAAVKKAIDQSGLSRDKVCDMVKVLTDIKLTKYMLDQCLAHSKKAHRLPGEVITAICYVTSSLEPMQALLAPLGSQALSPDETRDLKILKLTKAKEQIEAQITVLKGGAKC